MSVPPRKARELILAGNALRYRLPWTGGTLAQGRIDEHRFHIMLTRTTLVTPELIPHVDSRIAEQIFGRDTMSTTRFTAMLDAIVASTDPALHRRRAHATAERKVTITPDRFVPANPGSPPTSPNSTPNSSTPASTPRPPPSTPTTPAPLPRAILAPTANRFAETYSPQHAGGRTHDGGHR
ncbi:DUF222 domain-containing protein [Gordonia sp. NPDC003376]